MNRKLALILILIGIIGLVFYAIYFLKGEKKPADQSGSGGLFPQVSNNDGFTEISDILKNTTDTENTVNTTEELSLNETETYALTDYRVSSGYIDSQTISTLQILNNDLNLKNTTSSQSIQSESFTESIIPIAKVIAFKDSAYNSYDLITKKMQVLSSDKAYGSYYSDFINPKRYLIQLWDDNTKRINSFIGNYSLNTRDIATCPQETELLSPKYTPRIIESAQQILSKIYNEELFYTPGNIDDVTKRMILQFQIARKLKQSSQFDTNTKKELVLVCKEQYQAILDSRLQENNSEALGKTVFKKMKDNISDYYISDENIFSVIPDGKNSIISMVNSELNTEKTISELPLREWNIASVINQDLLLLYQNPTMFIENYLFQLNTKNDSFVPIIGPEKGLSAFCDNKFCIISYLNRSDNTLISEIYNITTRERNRLPFATLTEKCNFNNEILFCGVPKSVTSEIPDSWYRGIEHTDDILTEYNPNTKDLKLIDTGKELDIYSISKKMINNIDYYGYIDRTSGFYYITQKKLPENPVNITEEIQIPFLPNRNN